MGTMIKEKKNKYSQQEEKATRSGDDTNENASIYPFYQCNKILLTIVGGLPTRQNGKISKVDYFYKYLSHFSAFRALDRL